MEKFNNEKYLDYGYITSKDYDLLYNLIMEKKYRIICLLKYSEKSKVKDVCVSSATDIFNDIIISSRGIGYIHALDLNDFKEQCIKSDLEFIPPQKN